MLRTLTVIASAAFVSAQTPVWEYVGGPGISDGPAISCQLAIAPDGMPAIAFQDQSLAGIPASVLRLANGAWSYAGPKGGASVGQAWYTRLEFAVDGELFMTCREYAASGRISLRRFGAATNLWSSVGPLGASPGEAHYTDLALRRDGTPYVIYADRTTQPGDKATAMRFENGLWHLLDGFGFTPGVAAYTSIEVDPSGRVLAAFDDFAHYDPVANAGRATVMAYDPAGDSWSALGSPGFSPHGAPNLTLAIDRDGAPWIAYYRWHAELVVMRFDGSAWVVVGGSAAGPDRPAIETEGWRQWLSLAFDSQNLPYVAYQRYDDDHRAAVRRFRNGQWEAVGNLGFTPTRADYLALAIAPDDVPWVVFRDASQSGRASVMRFAPQAQVYCEGVVSSLGCLPSISIDGTPSLSAQTPCWIRASNVISNRTGLLLYSTRPDRTPFQAGTLCLGLPFRRTGPMNSGGNPPPSDCSGSFERDFNHWMQTHAQPELVPGRRLFAQYFYRDRLNPLGPGLTDAVSFEIQP